MNSHLVLAKFRSLLIKAMLQMLAMSLVVIAAIVLDETGVYRAAVVILPASLLVLFLSLGYSTVRLSRVFVLTPIPIFFGFAMLTFGIGPLVHTIGPEEARDLLEFRWRMGSEDLFRVQVLNLYGLLLVVFAIFVGTYFIRGRSQKEFSGDTEIVFATFSDATLYKGGLLLLVSTVLLRIVDRFFLPDVVSQLSGVSSLISGVGWCAILVFGILAGRRVRSAWILLIPVLVLELIAGALQLDRFNLLLPMVVFFLGLFLGGRSVQVLVIGALIVAITYILTRSIIDIGREEVWVRESMTTTEFYSKFSSGHLRHIQPRRPNTAGWWRRFDYTPIQNGLMNEYESGRPGDTFSQLYWIFVPRALNPEKPIFDYGTQVTLLLMGHEDSSTGTTIFGEAYWNGGWTYVITSSLCYGFLLVVNSLVCLWLFKYGGAFAWPVAMFGILSGALVRNFFTIGVIGGSTIFLFLSTGFYVLHKLRVLIFPQAARG